LKKASLRLGSPQLREAFVRGEDGIPNFKAYLAGEWHLASDLMDVVSPIDLGVIARVGRVGTKHIEKMLGAVFERGRWEVRDIPGERRLEIYHKTADLLEKYRDEFAETLVVNAGKTRPAAEGEVKASIERLRRSDLDTRKILGDFIPGDWSLETLETEAVVRREPIGVVLAIVPFNYPLFDTVNKLVYSTIVGNAIIVKPASSTPLPVILLAKILELAGFPKRGLGVVTMRGSDMTDLVSDNRINGISLTGSTETGIRLLRSTGIKQFVMELGGGDPAIVLKDADIPWAVKRIVVGIASYAGQRCDAIKLVLAERSIYGELRRGLISELKKVRVGDPREPATVMGPLIDEETADEVVKGVQDAVRNGGRVLVGGRKLRKNYVEPTLVEMSKGKIEKTVFYKDEIFAAVAILAEVSDIEEAIRLANGRRYGLDASVFGKDVNEIRRLTRMLDVGAIYINDSPKHGIGYFPFGGRKDSGIGREGIGYTLDHVTSHKSVVYNYKGKGVWDYL
jgi:glyceraldehyde-3-phosphate dehydrogenase [NAD(P)+]